VRTETLLSFTPADSHQQGYGLDMLFPQLDRHVRAAIVDQSQGQAGPVDVHLGKQPPGSVQVSGTALNTGR
jgi:hypothetical protein